MKCYYEVLGVPRDVNDEDLKKTYRKLALKWHPDKNLDNASEAKEQFQLVQQAYEVLSDPQERAWYDNHRESILRGAGSDYKDDSLDVFQYFTPSCFKGYGDDDKGFYTVYSEVFNKLAAEDLEHISDEDSDFEIPSFGRSDSSYEDVVRPFYAYWQSYSTKKSYAWLDPYDIRDAPNRRVVRAAEKENKKVRDKARKQRNEEVRNLVAFVRKRDKRVQEYVKLLEERALENAKKSEERRKKIIRERQEAVKNYKESEWYKFSNMEKELEAIEANLAEEFGESEESSREELESDKEEVDAVVDSLYCVACNKIFKTAKAFENHENSKKHKENVEVLKISALNDEKQMKEAEHNVSAEDSVHSNHEISSSSESIVEPKVNIENISENAIATGMEKQAKKRNKKQKLPNTYNVSDDDVSDIEFDMTCGQSKKQRKKQRHTLQVQKKQECNGDADDLEADTNLNNKSSESVVEENIKSSLKKVKDKEVQAQNSSEGQINKIADNNTSISSDSNKVKIKKGKDRKDKKFDSVNSVQDLNHCCVTCHSEFSSKNKLFDHLKKTGHSVYIPQATATKTKERLEERVKGKGKRSK